MKFYFSNSKLIKSIRNIFNVEKPSELGLHEWDDWYNDLKKNRPLAYMTTEAFPDLLQKIMRNTFGRIGDYYDRMSYKLWKKCHIIDTGLEPAYHCIDTRMLHASFQLLVDFIEIELARTHVGFSKERQKEFGYSKKMFGATRCKEAGITHLTWEMTLDSITLGPYERNIHQAHAAREKYALYVWWTETRPNRGDVHDVSGWSAICDELTEKYGKGLMHFRKATPDEKRREKEALDRCHKLEEDWEIEDEEMLIRLIKIRRSLWS
jgi:hypothetical protein